MIASPVRDLVELLDHELRLDDVIGIFVRERPFFAPGVDLLEPALADLVPGLFDVVKLLVEVHHHMLHIAHDRDVHTHVLPDRGRIDVDMDDLGLGRESFHLAGHPVVEPRADGDDEVGIMDRHVGVVGAVHAEHAERERMRAGKPADAHQGMGHRDLRDLGELKDLRRGIREDNAAADIGHRLLCLGNRLGRLLDLPLVAG